MKGIITVYINLKKTQKIDVSAQIDSIMTSVKEHNASLIQAVEKEGEYLVMFVPCFEEATRIEKIDFNAPFPRFLPRNVDLPLPMNILMDRTPDGKDEDEDED